MTLEECFPIWEKLNDKEKEQLKKAASKRSIKEGTLLYNGLSECLGLLLVQSGELRAFITSQDGREITLYRLFAHDICLFSASCMLHDMQFTVSVEASKDTVLWMIPADVYKRLMDTSLTISGYTNRIMASRFSEVLWLMEQTLFTSFDKRLAAFLLEESASEGSDRLRITHEQIARHLGSAREVVTRMLRHFQSETLVKVFRGTIELTDKDGLARLAG